ncbi:hypothetical protein [Mesorhizobium sp. J428]|uniref:hypothetical protein n=1 Tax=Mesorhizobium sp. J428 TaxID=2898440 RepID=UPI0021512CCA|nr:hypothetical protein [Mesorhizobium sp. J428]MCR5858467.1 hypothetical protein [Mesorhizobium sp. J428]
MSTTLIFPPGIRLERGGDPVGIDRRLLAEVQPLDGDAERLHRQRPALAEPAGHQRERMVARAEHVGVRGLPCAMSVGNVDRDVMSGARKPLQVVVDARNDLVELARIDVRRGAMHRVEHAVGHDGRSGDGEVVASSRGHSRYPNCARCGYRGVLGEVKRADRRLIDSGRHAAEGPLGCALR